MLIFFASTASHYQAKFQYCGRSCEDVDEAMRCTPNIRHYHSKACSPRARRKRLLKPPPLFLGNTLTAYKILTTPRSIYAGYCKGGLNRKNCCRFPSGVRNSPLKRPRRTLYRVYDLLKNETQKVEQILRIVADILRTESGNGHRKNRRAMNSGGGVARSYSTPPFKTILSP